MSTSKNSNTSTAKVSKNDSKKLSKVIDRPLSYKKMHKEIISDVEWFEREFQEALDVLNEYREIVCPAEFENEIDEEFKSKLIESLIEQVISEKFNFCIDGSEIDELIANIEEWYEKDEVKKRLSKYEDANIQHIIGNLKYISNYDIYQLTSSIETIEDYDNVIEIFGDIVPCLGLIQMGVQEY